MDDNNALDNGGINDSAPLTRPAGAPFHWLYFVLYGLAMTAALWKHGHPAFTLTMLSLALPAACIIYVPYRFLGRETRSWLQISVVMLSILWAIFRLTQRVPIDKMLIETICMLGLSFAFTSRASDYGYQFLISILLLVYGALLPRTMYICILPVAFVIGLLVLYRSRLRALSGDSGIQVPKGIFRRNWRYLLLHAFISMLLWAYIYSVLPTKPSHGKGIISVSFRNENESYIAPQFNNWVKPKQVMKSSTGMLIPGSRPVQAGKSGPKVSSKDSKEAMESSGQGAGAPGKEIVFRVKSPVKLYWLGQLYDVYDGDKWIVSKQLKKQKLPWKNNMWSHTKRVEQKIIMEKWLPPVFFSAYRASYYNLGIAFRKKVLRTFYNEKLADKANYPELPFTYSVTSELVCEDLVKGQKNEKINLWFERIKPKHYMRLPSKKISKRLVKLARQITMHSKSDYDKAIALRDYLRNSFKYKMLSKKAPKGREAVDYFVFDLKEGHCEYFASSLAVLARLSKLPARVATGFSPGNYNALNGYFEVHEYHAHAWTQIFFKDKGWLTFDATPPGEIVSRTTPLGIGSLRDPFGDEWRVTPPEMTEITQKNIRPEKDNESTANAGKTSATAKGISDTRPPLLTRLFISIAMAPEHLGNSIDKMKERMFPAKKKGGIKFKDIFAAIRKNLTAALKKAFSGWKSFARWLATSLGLIFLAFIALIGVGIYLSPRVFRAISRKIRLKRCEEWNASAESLVRKNPPEAVSLCYRMMRELLALAGWPRIRNMELFDYGASLNKLDKDLSKNTLVVYFIYTKNVFSEDDVTVEDSQNAFDKARLAREFLLDYMKK